MKKNIYILFLALIYVFPHIIRADSPLTSTDIYKAYEDLYMVQTARKTASLTYGIALYLSSDTIKLDQKAAVINAIGWNINGTKNADLYCKYIYGKPLHSINIDDFQDDELFCIGYMQALDDYFHPKKALPYLEEAYKRIDTSFTVAIILALTKAQSIMDLGNWCKMWELTYKVLNNKHLYRDMNEKAIEIITNYMILYKC